MAAFVLGAICAAALVWSVGHAHERWRRIRRDIKTAKKGVKTLRSMLRRETGALLRAGAVVTLAVVVIAVLVTR